MKIKVTKKNEVELDLNYMQVDAHILYWKDCIINGVRDGECLSFDEKPLMPCAEWNGKEWRWRPVIDIATGQITNWNKGTEADVHYKVCDEFAAEIIDAEGNTVCEYYDYVPDCMYPKEEGYGDYIIMDIDTEGFIKGWDGDLVSEMIQLD